MATSNNSETPDSIASTLELLAEQTERLMQVAVKQSATARLQLAIADQNLEAIKHGAPTLLQELAAVSQQIAALDAVARSFHDAISQIDSDPVGLHTVRLRSRRRNFHDAGLMAQIRKLQE